MHTGHDLHRQSYKNFLTRDHETWKILFNNLIENRAHMACYLFPKGIKALGLSSENIPSLEEINSRLKALTGWTGIPVEGLESGDSFYPALARREFPIGNFIRDQDSLGYTPAPDVFHDLYGHIPFYADKDYADACQKFGEMVQRHLQYPERLKMFERFFWFTFEFGLVETTEGRRIFGAGILSSRDESIYSLSSKPEIVPFSVEAIINQNYRIDQIQPKLFILNNYQQLYTSFELLEDAILSIFS